MILLNMFPTRNIISLLISLIFLTASYLSKARYCLQCC